MDENSKQFCEKIFDKKNCDDFDARFWFFLGFSECYQHLMENNKLNNTSPNTTTSSQKSYIGANFICKCGKTYVSNAMLERHKRKQCISPNHTIHVCILCETQGRDAITMRKHVKTQKHISNVNKYEDILLKKGNNIQNLIIVSRNAKDLTETLCDDERKKLGIFI